jgi:hypothetical protein
MPRKRGRTAVEARTAFLRHLTSLEKQAALTDFDIDLGVTKESVTEPMETLAECCFVEDEDRRALNAFSSEVTLVLLKYALAEIIRAASHARPSRLAEALDEVEKATYLLKTAIVRLPLDLQKRVADAGFDMPAADGDKICAMVNPRRRDPERKRAGAAERRALQILDELGTSDLGAYQALRGLLAALIRACDKVRREIPKDSGGAMLQADSIKQAVYELARIFIEYNERMIKREPAVLLPDIEDLPRWDRPPRGETIPSGREPWRRFTPWARRQVERRWYERMAKEGPRFVRTALKAVRFGRSPRFHPDELIQDGTGLPNRDSGAYAGRGIVNPTSVRRGPAYTREIRDRFRKDKAPFPLRVNQ